MHPERNDKMGMALVPDDLLAGERRILSQSANMVISVKQSGLSRFAFDDFLGLVGMKGKEAIGGMVHLTNYRVMFKSHFLNRVRGKHSIFLPCIQSMSTTYNKLIVESSVQQFEFVMWMKQPFIDAVNQEKDGIDAEELSQLKEAIAANPGAVGAGLQKCVTMEVINQVCAGVRSVQSVVELLAGVDRNAFVELIDLFRPQNG